MSLCDADLIGNPCEHAALPANGGPEFGCGEVASPARPGVHHGATIAPSDTPRNYCFRMAKKTHRPASFGAWLESQLLRREWNQSDLARRIDVRPSVVSRWIRNERVPSPASVGRIADVLMVDVDDVLTRAGHRPALPTDDLDAIHARLDPYLRQVLDLPDTLDHIVALVAATVETATAIRSRHPERTPAAAESRGDPAATASPARHRGAR